MGRSNKMGSIEPNDFNFIFVNLTIVNKTNMFYKKTFPIDQYWTLSQLKTFFDL